MADTDPDTVASLQLFYWQWKIAVYWRENSLRRFERHPFAKKRGSMAEKLQLKEQKQKRSGI